MAMQPRVRIGINLKKHKNRQAEELRGESKKVYKFIEKLKVMNFEKINCNLCNSNNFKWLFQKDSCGVRFNIVKCKNCGFIYMNPMITKKSLEKLYPSEYYHNILQPFKLGKKELVHLSNKSTFQKITKITKLNKGNLLDVGCAAGAFLYSIKKEYPDWNVFGCDISKKCIKFGKKTFDLKLKAGEIKDCKYRDNFFDVITMREVIEHTPKPMEDLKEMNRILKIGGFIFIRTGNMESLIAKIKGKNHFYYVPVHSSYFSKKTIKMALEKSGFNVLKITGIHYSEEDKLKAFGFDIKTWLKLAGLKSLYKFGFLGGMNVFAQKIENVS